MKLFEIFVSYIYDTTTTERSYVSLGIFTENKVESVKAYFQHLCDEKQENFENYIWKTKEIHVNRLAGLKEIIAFNNEVAN